MTPRRARRRVEYMRLDALVPAPRNPKGHNIDEIRASIERFGFTAPPELDDRTDRLVAGHGRVESLSIAHALELDAPDGIDVDKSDGMWLVPIVRGWASKDDAEAEAYVIAANRLTETGGWDQPDVLADMLRAHRDAGTLDGIGYTSHDVDVLVSKLHPDALDTSSQMGSMEYRVLVVCTSEQHQADLLHRFEREGLTCQALIA